MKNTVKFISLIALAATAFVACSKTEVDVKDRTFTHRVSIHASQVETKTAINEGADAASFVWSADDASRFVVKENNVIGTEVDLALSNSNKTATLSATFATEPADEYVYSAFLAANLTGNASSSDRKPKIPATQNPTASSFDPDADILVAKSLTFDTTQDELNMQFARPVVINKMTLKGLTAGETVSTVVISGGDKKIVGYYTPDSQSWDGQGADITVNVNRTASSEGELVVYFVTMPVEGVTLTVTATTPENIYSKTFTKAINFVENQVTVFGVSGLKKTQKVDYSGTYVLTNKAGTKMAKKWSGDNIPAVDVTLEEGVIYFDPNAVILSDAQITVTRITDTESEYYNMYTMVQNGKYLYAASASSNYLKGEDEADVNAYWEISEADGEWSIVATKSENRNILRNNGNIFSCYASGQTPVALYDVKNVKTTPVIYSSVNKVSLESDAVETWTELNAGVAFNNDATTTTATAYDDEACTTTCTWLSVDIDETVVYKVTANNTGAERTAYIKIVATNNEGRSVSKVLEVTQNYAGAAIVYYKKVTTLTAGKTYLLVANGYAMGHPTGSSTITGTQVTVSDDQILQTSTTQSLEFVIDHCTVANFTDYYTIGFDVSGTTNYVYAAGSSSTKFNKTTSPVYNGNGTGCWTFASTSSYKGGSFLISNVAYEGSNRAILQNSGTFGFYANSNTGYYAVDLYELQTN